MNSWRMFGLRACLQLCQAVDMQSHHACRRWDIAHTAMVELLKLERSHSYLDCC